MSKYRDWLVEDAKRLRREGKIPPNIPHPSLLAEVSAPEAPPAPMAMAIDESATTPSRPLHRKSKQILERLMARARMDMPESEEEQRDWYQWFMRKRNLSAAKKLMKQFDEQDRSEQDRFELMRSALESRYGGIEPGRTYTRADLMTKAGKGGTWRIKGPHQDKMFYDPRTGMRMEGGRAEQAAFLEMLNRQAAAAASERYALMAEEAGLREAERSSGMNLTGVPALDTIIANREMQKVTQARSDREYALDLLREQRAQEAQDFSMGEVERTRSQEQAYANAAKAVLGTMAGDPNAHPITLALSQLPAQGMGPRLANTALQWSIAQEQYGRDLAAEDRQYKREWEKILFEQGTADTADIRKVSQQKVQDLTKAQLDARAWRLENSLKSAAGGVNVFGSTADLADFMQSAKPEEVVKVIDTISSTTDELANAITQHSGNLMELTGLVSGGRIQGVSEQQLGALMGADIQLLKDASQLQEALASIQKRFAAGERTDALTELERGDLADLLEAAGQLNMRYEQSLRSMAEAFALGMR